MYDMNSISLNKRFWYWVQH